MNSDAHLIRYADCERKNGREIEIDVNRFLDTQERIVSEGEDAFVQIPFAGDNLTHLERRMGGGLLGGRLYILGGIPSASKTMLVNNIADNICLNSYPVIFFSYDDGRDELRKRTLSRFSGIHIEQFNRNRVSKDDIVKICRAPQIKGILGRKYVVEDMINLNKWDAIIDQIVKSEKKAPVIIIDYLRKLRTERHIGDERLRVDEILCRLKAIAMKYNTPVLAVSELARDSYKSGQRLSMASFKESGSIEYDASWLGILAAVEEDEAGDFNLMNNWERIIEDTGNVDLIVLKAKRGTGLRGRVPLKADRDHMIIRDREVKATGCQKTAGQQIKVCGRQCVMDNIEAMALLTKINQEYETVPAPKYRNIDLDQCERLYQQLLELKSEVSETELYKRLLGALSQILAKQRRLTVKKSR